MNTNNKLNGFLKRTVLIFSAFYMINFMHFAKLENQKLYFKTGTIVEKRYEKIVQDGKYIPHEEKYICVIYIEHPETKQLRKVKLTGTEQYKYDIGDEYTITD